MTPTVCTCTITELPAWVQSLLREDGKLTDVHLTGTIRARMMADGVTVDLWSTTGHRITPREVSA